MTDHTINDSCALADASAQKSLFEKVTRNPFGCNSLCERASWLIRDKNASYVLMTC
jgi:hypothetical protein